jgi:arylsulfatase A-like enzyme
VHYLDPHEPRRKMAPFDFGDTESDEYDTEVAFSDREVGRLVDWLRETGRMNDTIVVLVADHGESFLDHGMDHHGNRPYDEQIHVPMVMWAPDVAPARVAEPVGVWDIAPTVLAYLGLPAIPGAEGRDVLRARPEPRPIFAETPLNLVEVSFFSYAVTAGNWRYIYDVRGNTVELYDLDADAGELHNLVDLEPAKAAELRAVLAAWLDSTRSVRSLRNA